MSMRFHLVESKGCKRNSKILRKTSGWCLLCYAFTILHINEIVIFTFALQQQIVVFSFLKQNAKHFGHWMHMDPMLSILTSTQSSIINKA